MPTHLAENTTIKNLTRGFTGGRVDLDTDELDEPSNCLILSESIAGSFRLFQWSLRPERTECGDNITYDYFVEPICARQVRDILEHPSLQPVDVGPDRVLCLDPSLCQVHTAIGKILEFSGATAALLRYQCEAPELGIYRIPACIAGDANFGPLSERFKRALTTTESSEQEGSGSN